MRTFVLTPGGMCGGWLWQRLVPLLRAAGHEAHPVTLTGNGDRAHLAGPTVDLDTHIADLVNVLFYEDLSEVILVGHSYAGMVIAGVAEIVPERISRLVYIDAAVPLDGQSFNDVRSIAPPETDDTWQEPVPFAQEETREFLRDIAEDDVAWFYERMTPRLPRTLAQPVRLRNPDAAAIPCTYVLCLRNEWGEPPPPDILRARTELDWDYREIEADHVPMFTRPRELADLLQSLG